MAMWPSVRAGELNGFMTHRRSRLRI